MKPERGYEALRSHRLVGGNLTYFITLCSRDRQSGLNIITVANSICAELHALVADRVIELRAWVVMPDHVHLFFSIVGDRLVGQVIGRLKAKTRGTLKAHGLGWQGNFYERRIRQEDSFEDVVRYIFLNPYRARLIAVTDVYPYFGLGPAETVWFRPSLNDDRPWPEWLDGGAPTVTPQA